MRRAKLALELAASAVEKGNRNSMSDAAVAVLALQAAARGAYFNVRINLPGLGDADFRKSVSTESETLYKEVTSGAEKMIESAANAMTQTIKNRGE